MTNCKESGSTGEELAWAVSVLLAQEFPLITSPNCKHRNTHISIVLKLTCIPHIHSMATLMSPVKYGIMRISGPRDGGTDA